MDDIDCQLASLELQAVFPSIPIHNIMDIMKSHSSEIGALDDLGGFILESQPVVKERDLSTNKSSAEPSRNQPACQRSGRRRAPPRGTAACKSHRPAVPPERKINNPLPPERHSLAHELFITFQEPSLFKSRIVLSGISSIEATLETQLRSLGTGTHEITIIRDLEKDEDETSTYRRINNYVTALFCVNDISADASDRRLTMSFTIAVE